MCLYEVVCDRLPDCGDDLLLLFAGSRTQRDGSQLGAVLDPNNTASAVRADTTYRSRANVELLDPCRVVPELQRAKPRGKPMPAHISHGSATQARVRSLADHVVAAEKRRTGLVVRSIGLVRATARITLANLAYNMRRPVWIEGRGTSA